MFIVTVGFLMIGNYKDYGEKKGHKNDELLGVIGQIMSICNSLSRITHGYLINKYGFKIIGLINSIAALIVAVLIPLLATNIVAFFIL